MLPVYRCQKCNTIFCEWLVEGKPTTPWKAISEGMAAAKRDLKGDLVCPSCGHNNGFVLWTLGQPFTLFNWDFRAQLLTVTNVPPEEAKDADKLIEHVKKAYPDGVVATFTIASTQHSKEEKKEEESE